VTASAARDARRHFRRRRRHALGAASLTIVTLAVLAALLVAPNRLASLRLGEVALAWWMTAGVALVGFIALGRGLRERHPVDVSARSSRLVPLALAAVWGSPALWLSLPPLLAGDGIRGLWPAAVTISGVIVAMVLLRTPWAGAGGLVARTSVVVGARWPGARGCQILLGSIEGLVAALFAWAQFAAVRELGAMVGWPRALAIGVAGVVLAAALLPAGPRVRVAALGGGFALVSLSVPLVAIALGTTVAWPGVFSAVASRDRIAFNEGTAWTLDGGAVRGPGATATMRFLDEQRVAFSGRATVTLEPHDGPRLVREVQAGEELVLHPGDRLIVPAGVRLRFEPGRRVPDAPDSGPAWVEPPSWDARWLGLVALGLTGLLGAVGLPAGAPAGNPDPLPRRSAQMTVGLVTAGVALAVGWGLYAVWLTPEVYAGGVTGAEVYALAASVSGLGEWGDLLAWVALGGLAVGGGASALAGLRGVPGLEDPGPARARTPYVALGLVAGAGLLGCLAPIGPWTVLVLALGVSASALAPAAVLAGWSERASPRGVAAGATVGLLAFLIAAFAAVQSPAGTLDGWRAAVTGAPAMLAVPAHLAAAWLLRARRGQPLRLSPQSG
jgi:hypothetical protein